MTQTETSQDKGAIPALQDAVIRGLRMAEKPEVAPGNVKLWIASTRAPLRKAFGPDSTILSLWPTHDIPVSKESARATLFTFIQKLEQLISLVTEAAEIAVAPSVSKRIFLGHGRSPVWRELKDFLSDRLNLPWEEFNRESVAGITTSDRLHEMLSNSSFALLIMTAEDAHSDASMHARENVIHEVGLFQGKLGLRKTIVLLEEGCEQFSNIHGLSHISFPRTRVSAAFEDIRRVLEREHIIQT